MASQTASDILHILGEGQVSLTDIAERLDLPLNTVKYHLENLLDAGLVTVSETKYSIKGREVKMYSLANQLLIVAPRESPVRSLILKYASLFGIVALASILIAALSPVIRPELLNGESMAAGTGPRLATVHDGGSEVYAAKAVAEATSALPNGTTAGADLWGKGADPGMIAGNATPLPAPDLYQCVAQAPPALPASAGTTGSFDLAFAFFLGGILVIVVLLCYEAWLWKKR